MDALDLQGWFTLGVVVVMLGAMARGVAAPDLIMMAGLFVLAVVGVLTPEETFRGFANPAMMTVGALFVLSAAMRETGALEITLGRLFGRSKSEGVAMVRLHHRRSAGSRLRVCVTGDLPDPPACLRPRRLSLHGLRPCRSAPESDLRRGGHHLDPDDLAPHPALARTPCPSTTHRRC